MNAKNTTKTFVIALAMMLTLAIGSSEAFGQKSPSDEQGSDLVGVWESTTPVTADCQTGAPDPNSPIIKVLYTLNQGGTMSENNTDPTDGSYRTAGQGIWKRTSARNFTAVYQHYSFDPDSTHTVTVKIRTNITLGKNSNSLTERGTFEVFLPNDDVHPIFGGCFADTANRLTF